MGLSDQLKYYLEGEEDVKKSRQPIFKSSIMTASNISGMKKEPEEKKAKKRHIEDYVPLI